MDEEIIIPLDEEDSYYRDEPINIESELDAFRRQWKQEIRTQRPSQSPDGSTQGDSKASTTTTAAAKDEDLPSVEEQAKFLFLQGVNSEQNGKLYDAIQYYRRAVQLVPDIEFRIDEYNQHKKKERPRPESESSVGGSDIGEEEDIDLEDLIQHLSRMTANDPCICGPQFDQRSTHIGALPFEVLMYIFKWVVSMDLDITSLESLALTCRGFYLSARDQELWRLVCQRIWGVNCGRPGSYGTYRDMYIQRPHVRVSGCYISKSTYYRPGEKGMDNFYRPFHLVAYYRYIRFFPEGQVLMLTSPEEPKLAIPRLKGRGSRVSGILHGYYKMAGNQVTAVLKRRKSKEATYYRYKRQRNKENDQNRMEQTFQAEFELDNAGRRQCCQLAFKHYSVTTLYKATGQENTVEFDLGNKSYPQLIFSRVKSYAATTDSFLQ